jgi:ParB/RepB/Spo0J family partition protein
LAAGNGGHLVFVLAAAGEAFAEMCANVGRYGVLQPVLVRPSSRPGRYTLISGEFRYQAARERGLASLPCYIEEVPLDPASVLLRRLSENLHRRALSHLDLARTFHRLTLPAKEGGGGMKGKDLARLLGKSDAFISEHRNLLQLSPEDQRKVEDGTLTFDQARLMQRRGHQHDTGDTAVPTSEAGVPDTGGECHAGETPAGGLVHSRERLSSGQYIYQEYTARNHQTGLTILVAGAEETGPDIDCVVLAVSRHLHFLKLLQNRRGKKGAGKR